MGIEDSIIQLVTIAVGALMGSAFMWLVLGPLVIRRAAPKLIRRVMRDVAGLTDADVEEAKGDFFKAMTKKQGDTFAQAIYGALGNIVQGAPTGELDKLAQKYGFEGTEDAAAKIMGGQAGGLANGPGNGGIANILGALSDGGVGGGKKNNSFAGIVQLIVAINALSGGLGGNGGGIMGGGQGGGTFRPGLSGR